MASSAPSTPRRHFLSIEPKSSTPQGAQQTSGGGGGGSGIRSRLDSAEIPRTYSGLYGAGAPPMPGILVEMAGSYEDDPVGNSIPSPPRVKSSVAPSAAAATKTRARHGQSNLLPFELTLNRNTDWIAAGGPSLLVTYIYVIMVFLLTFLAFVPEPKLAWAMTNVTHGMVSMVYLHWIKGNPADYMDGTQGEMNAMTCWEQIVSKPAIHLHGAASKKTSLPSKMDSPARRLRESVTCAVKKLRSREVLSVVPTFLAHASCHIAKYQFEYVMVNVGVWAVVMLPKMPFMNGVRILGINRTAGIDDGGDLEEEEDVCLDTGEESSKKSIAGLDFNNEGGNVEAKVEPKKDR